MAPFITGFGGKDRKWPRSITGFEGKGKKNVVVVYKVIFRGNFSLMNLLDNSCHASDLPVTGMATVVKGVIVKSGLEVLLCILLTSPCPQ